MLVIAKERTCCSRRPNENAQTVAPARQIRPGMRGRQKGHFSHALDETQCFGAVGCLIRCLSQDLFDDKTAETVPGQYQLARPKIRFHQQQIEHIGRTVGSIPSPSRASPTRAPHSPRSKPTGLRCPEPAKPARKRHHPCGLPRALSVAAEAVEENHVGALRPPRFGDQKQVCHLRPRRGLTRDIATRHSSHGGDFVVLFNISYKRLYYLSFTIDTWIIITIEPRLGQPA